LLNPFLSYLYLYPFIVKSRGAKACWPVLPPMTSRLPGFIRLPPGNAVSISSYGFEWFIGTRESAHRSERSGFGVLVEERVFSVLEPHLRADATGHRFAGSPSRDTRPLQPHVFDAQRALQEQAGAAQV